MNIFTKQKQTRRLQETKVMVTKGERDGEIY